MRYFSMVLLLLFVACEPELSNDTKTINSLLLQDDLNLELRFSGCFNSSTELYSLEKDEKGYMLTSKSTKNALHLEPAQMVLFKEYLNRINDQYMGGLCTSSIFVLLDDGNYLVKVEDSNCDGELNTILRYDELR